MKITNKQNFQFISFIVVGTIPLIISYLFFYDFLKNIHSNLELGFQIASYSFIVTGCVLLMTKYIKSDAKDLTYGIVLIIGVMQCIAILPGISRSGITISIALLLGISSKNATKFSFTSKISC